MMGCWGDVSMHTNTLLGPPCAMSGVETANESEFEAEVAESRGSHDLHIT